MKKAQKNQDNTFILGMYLGFLYSCWKDRQPCSQSPLAGSEMCCFVGQKPSADSRNLVLEVTSSRGLEKRKVKTVSQRGGSKLVRGSCASILPALLGIFLLLH